MEGATGVAQRAGGRFRHNAAIERVQTWVLTRHSFTHNRAPHYSQHRAQCWFRAALHPVTKKRAALSRWEEKEGWGGCRRRETNRRLRDICVWGGRQRSRGEALRPMALDLRNKTARRHQRQHQTFHLFSVPLACCQFSERAPWRSYWRIYSGAKYDVRKVKTTNRWFIPNPMKRLSKHELKT